MDSYQVQNETLYHMYNKMKKKISLITIFDVANFGTYLQTLATAVILQNLGASVEVVHYERPFKNTKLLRKNFILRYFYYLYFWLRGYDGCLFMYRCRRFVSKYTRISRTYFSIDELKKNPPVANVYVTGSDQVWNTDHNQGIDEAYYLCYAPTGKKKVSYAASIGQDSIPEQHKKRTFELLSQYDAISVREDNAVRLLTELGLKATHVLDPTLLLNREEWLKYSSKRKVIEDYLLVYSVEPVEYDYKVADIAKKIAGKKNLKIVSVSNWGAEKRIPDCDMYFDYALPQDFLSLMAYASFVVASSFHGTAFAINFNRQFITITPGAFSSRISSLLSLIGLENRRINSAAELSEGLLKEQIDFSYVNSKLALNRNRSINYIRRNIIE